MRSALVAGVAALCGCATTPAAGLPPVKPVERVDLERYLGTWYEIASFPQRFQKGCTGTTATYTKRADGRIDVLNRCRLEKLDGKLKEAKGLARVVDESGAKLQVSFFRPFWAKYWIIDLASDYSWAVVGEPGRDYLWILSRTPRMDETTYAGIVERLQATGWDVTRLQRQLQP